MSRIGSRILIVFGAFLVAALISFSGAMAQGYTEMTIFPNQISVCPCSSITPEHISVDVKNLHFNTDSYKFTLNAPPGWSSQIQDSLVLGSGEEGSLDLFLINVGCDVSPGIYTASVTADSQTRQETVTENLEIDVLLCRGAELTVVGDKEKGTCFEEPVPLTYDFEIKNLGKFEETFELTSSVEWAGFSESEITLNGGETRGFSVVLNPEQLSMGMYMVTISARSTNPGSLVYYSPVTRNIELYVNDCYDFLADLQPKENEVCFGDSVEYSLMIENTGQMADSYSIYTPGWVTSDESEVSLEPGQKTILHITATPGIQGTQDVSLTVTPVKESTNSKKVTSTVTAGECRSVAVIASPSDYTICSGKPPVDFDISVKNTGTVGTTYQLSSNLGVIQDTSLTIAPGETRTTTMTLDIAGLEGRVDITVTAADGEIYDETKISLMVENCYKAVLTIEPDMQAVCPYDSVSYVVKLENTGEMSDSYILKYGDQAEPIDLEPGDSESFELTFLVPFEEAGAYMVSALADSDQVSLTSTAALNVKTLQECYNAEMDAPGEKRIRPCTIDECDATTVPVQIKNTGEKPVLYSISVEGLVWIHFEPTELNLKPGESGIVYVYLSPDFGVEKDTYTLVIKAESDYLDIIHTMDVVVTDDLTGEGDGTDVSLNASTGNITGAIIGGDRPAWKTILVAVIALIIIIILAIRFILLVKK